ncbi:carboxypeptidase M32 [Methylobacterium sp. C25]|uniref:carboxypeptidase M32 n=1 Tax=Methylobacterium sp. C25 TaxID=2721622 RepID=UPI001F42D1E9|nr:carboxypeptidase M32 [Methylobacterium sp. C25]MCE4224209.1 carboxypeptidase M32 [Methylobacterium sp. C25]
MQAYRSPATTFSRLGAIEDASGILGWDMQTLMPDGASDMRGEQLATLSVLAHEILTSQKTADALAEAEEEVAALGEWERANLREMRRTYIHASAVPGDLVEASSKAATRSEMAWREARKQGDFAMLAPHLAETLRLQRQIGEAKGAVLGLSPYDALLDGYDPGMRQARIDALFATLRATLPDLLARVQARQAALAPAVPLPGRFPVESQKQLGLTLMRAAGFDFERGRLDVSLHPFCGGATDDVRITTRYDEADATRALMGVMHETGHALYEQGRPAAWRHQPVSQARGMSLHESQSLLIEMQACRSREFVDFLAPRLREAFGGDGAAWEADNVYRLYTRVEPGFIRVDADEVTYPAHILLRYELETAMVAGDLTVADLPGAFNEGMKRLLGLTVTNDREGCLQDIHWPGGSFGYFPTYTLGAMGAAQLFAAACEALPGIRPALAQGDFSGLCGWLRENVHAKGSLLQTDELFVAATGKPLGAEDFLAHLERRYAADAAVA